MVKVIRLPGHERRAQLLEVAQRVFAEKGFDGTTMTDVAEAAGVTKPVVYQHFASKRDLYSTVLTALANELIESILSATSSATSPREQLTEGILGYLKSLQHDDTAFQILFDGANRRDDEWNAFGTQVRQTLADAIATLLDVDSIGEDRRRTTAIGILGMVEAMSLAAWSIQQPPDIDQLTNDIVELLWPGLRVLGKT